MTNAYDTTDLTAALALLDGVEYRDGDDNSLTGVVYYAAETRRYYAVDVQAVEDLAARLERGDPEAYSLWCAETGYADPYRTAAQAATAEGWLEEEEEESKDAVDRWETVDGYTATFATVDGEGSVEVAVQIGEAGGRWYVRTEDPDGGGSDEGPDEGYPTSDAAIVAAYALAGRLGGAS